MGLMASAIVAAVLFVAAGVFSMLGQGGGAIYTPVQVMAGAEFHAAATTSLFLIMVMSLSSSLVFRKAGKIDWPLALALESTTAVGGFAGGWWSSAFSGNALSVVFALAVALAGLFMIRRFHRSGLPGTGRAGFPVWRRACGDQQYQVNMALALPLSLVVGLASGLVGVGGGILMVPLMVLLLGVPMDIAIGSSAFMVGLTAAGGFAGHIVRGHWDWRFSLVLAGAVFVGAQVGSRVSLKLDRAWLKVVFGWFLLVVAAAMVARAF